MATRRSRSASLGLAAPALVALALTAACTTGSGAAPAPAPVTVTAPASASAPPVSVAESSSSAAAPSLSDADTEKIFLKLLDDQKVQYSSASKVIQLGRAVCSDRRGGASQEKLVQDIMDNSDFDAYTAGFIVGAAEGSFCPSMTG